MNGEKVGMATMDDRKDSDVSIPFDFNAFDSELQEASYYIPKGYFAEIKDDKVIIKKANKKQSPKYKAGDWIVSKYGDLFQIKEVVAGGYKLLCPSGNEEINSFGIVDKSSHLWTIKDAKDGDILCVYNNIFIFKEYINWEYKVYSYCELFNGEKIASDHCAYICSGDEETLMPATKEQQKLLFEKIAEAGYKWDAEKKELKKLKM